MTNNNYDDHHDDDNDYYYCDHNNNYDDLDKELDEALESIERQCKDGGLSGKETLKEAISFIGEQQKAGFNQLVIWEDSLPHFAI